MLAKVPTSLPPGAIERMARIDDLVAQERARVATIIDGPVIEVDPLHLPAPLPPGATRKQAKAHALRVRRAQDRHRQALIEADAARRAEAEAEELAPAVTRRPVTASTGETIREALVEIDRGRGGSVRALRWLPAKMLVRGQITIAQSLAAGRYLDLVETAAGARDSVGAGCGEATPPWLRAGFTDQQAHAATCLRACRIWLGPVVAARVEAVVNASTMDEARQVMHVRRGDACIDAAVTALAALDDWFSGRRMPA